MNQAPFYLLLTSQKAFQVSRFTRKIAGFSFCHVTGFPLFQLFGRAPFPNRHTLSFRKYVSECVVSVPITSQPLEFELDKLEVSHISQPYDLLKILLPDTVSANVWRHIKESKQFSELLDGFETFKSGETASLLVIIFWNKYLNSLPFCPTDNNMYQEFIFKSHPCFEEITYFWEENISKITPSALSALTLLMKLQKLDYLPLWSKAVYESFNIRDDLSAGDLAKLILSLRENRNELLSRSSLLQTVTLRLQTVIDSNDLVFLSTCLQCFRSLLSSSILECYHDVICEWIQSGRIKELEAIEIVKILSVLSIKSVPLTGACYDTIKYLLNLLIGNIHLVPLQEMSFLKEINQNLGFITDIDNEIASEAHKLLSEKSLTYWKSYPLDYLVSLGLVHSGHDEYNLAKDVLNFGLIDKSLLVIGLNTFLKNKSFRNCDLVIFHKYLNEFCQYALQYDVPDQVYLPVVVNYIECFMRPSERNYHFENIMSRIIRDRLTASYGQNTGKDVLSFAFLLLFDKYAFTHPVMNKGIDLIPKLSNYETMLMASALIQRKKRLKNYENATNECISTYERTFAQNLPKHIEKCTSLLHYSSLLRTSASLANDYVGAESVSSFIQAVRDRKHEIYPKIVFNMCKGLAAMKFRSPEIVELFEGFLLKDQCSSITALRTYFEMCYICQAWPSSEEIYQFTNDRIRDNLGSNTGHALPIAFYLACCNRLAGAVIDTIFSVDFMKILNDHESKRASRNKFFMHLNRILCLTRPDKNLPWLCDDDIDFIPSNRRSHVFNVASVLQEIPNFSEAMKVFSILPYNIRAFIETRLDKAGYPVNLRLWEDDLQGKKRLALMPFSADSFCSNNHSIICGFQNTHKLALELLGYSVIIIPEIQWNSLELSSTEDKVNYLVNVLVGAGAKL